MAILLFYVVLVKFLTEANNFLLSFGQNGIESHIRLNG